MSYPRPGTETRPRDTRSYETGDPFKGAPCRDEDPDLGFPADGERGEARVGRTLAAKVVCARCPLVTKQRCLDRAMAFEGARPADARYGVWGGLSPEERASLARRRQRAEPVRREPPTHDDRCGTLAGDMAHRRRGEDLCEPCSEARRQYQAQTRAVRAQALAGVA